MANEKDKIVSFLEKTKHKDQQKYNEEYDQLGCYRHIPEHEELTNQGRNAFIKLKSIIVQAIFDVPGKILNTKERLVLIEFLTRSMGSPEEKGANLWWSHVWPGKGSSATGIPEESFVKIFSSLQEKLFILPDELLCDGGWQHGIPEPHEFIDIDQSYVKNNLYVCATKYIGPPREGFKYFLNLGQILIWSEPEYREYASVLIQDIVKIESKKFKIEHEWKKRHPGYEESPF